MSDHEIPQRQHVQQVPSDLADQVTTKLLFIFLIFLNLTNVHYFKCPTAQRLEVAAQI
jgi:hypothetical protein